MRVYGTWLHIDGLVQERRNPSALAMDLSYSCTDPSICDQQKTESNRLKNFKNNKTHLKAFLKSPVIKLTGKLSTQDEICLLRIW